MLTGHRALPYAACAGGTNYHGSLEEGIHHTARVGLGGDLSSHQGIHHTARAGLDVDLSWSQGFHHTALADPGGDVPTSGSIPCPWPTQVAPLDPLLWRRGVQEPCAVASLAWLASCAGHEAVMPAQGELSWVYALEHPGLYCWDDRCCHGVDAGHRWVCLAV